MWIFIGLSWERQKVQVRIVDDNHVSFFCGRLSFWYPYHKGRRRRWSKFSSSHWVKVCSRLVKSLQTLSSDLLSLWLFLCCLRWEWSFCQMSEEHGHQPSLPSASSYFDTLKHLPSVKRGRGRHRENNSEWASFQPLLSAWSTADRLSLKPIKGQHSLLPFKAQENTP